MEKKLDSIFYKKLYKDVKENPEEHWKNIGIKEERIPNEEIYNNLIKQKYALKLVKINLMREHCENKKTRFDIHENSYYFNLNNINKIDRNKLVISSIIDLTYYNNYEDYELNVKNKTKKKHNPLSSMNTSINRGYYCKKFEYENYINDIYDINTSKKIRCGREMNNSYMQDIRNANLNKLIDDKKIDNNFHYQIMFGIFKHIDGYKQGQIITNEKLVGYISFIRCGNLVLYSRILGHGDYLIDNIMYQLHFYIIKEWIYNKNNKPGEQINYVLYGGHYDGVQDKLKSWKEKLLFEPINLCV